MSVLRKPALHWILGIALGGVFLAASYGKIAEPRQFARIIYHYQVIGPNATIPPAVPNAFAVALPYVEALAGILLVSGLWRREAAGTVALLLLVFLFAVSSALYHHLDIENCGCFSLSGAARAAGVKLLLEDSALLLGALLLAAFEPTTPSQVPSLARAQETGIPATR
jgi:uncharacterized membrane protein YphA (DoxX/SURF4 family)